MNAGNIKKTSDDFEMLPEYDFSQAMRGRFYSPKKVSTSIRLDDDVVLYFKKKSGEEKIGYQTLMNSALRDYINHHAR